MYKPTFIPPQHRPTLKRPAAPFTDDDDDEEEEDENTVRILDNHPRSIPVALSPVIPNSNASKPQGGITKNPPVSIFSPRPHKRTRLGLGVLPRPPQPAVSISVTQKPKPKAKNTPHPARVGPETPRKGPTEDQPFPSTPSSSSSSSSPSSSRRFTALFPSTPSSSSSLNKNLFPHTPSRSPRPNTPHYTPYPTHASDSPSNPLGPARARQLKRTIPPPTSLRRHVVFRFQFVRAGAGDGPGVGGHGVEEQLSQEEEAQEAEEEADEEEEQEEEEEHEEAAEASGNEQEDTPPRQGGVHRIVRVPMSYTFAHLKCLIGWLFDEDARPRPLPGLGLVHKNGQRRRETWFDGEEDNDDDYELNDDDEEDYDDDDEDDPFSPSSNQKQAPPPPPAYPYLFEVQKKVCTYSPLYKPGQIKTGTPFVKLSSVRDPVATILSASASAGLGGGVDVDEDEDEDEDELCLDGNEKENAVNEEEEEGEEEEEWKWADEEAFTIGHIFPRGIDGEIGIIYHHSPTIQIHMTVNKSPVATQKGRANTPFVFTAQGRTNARLGGAVPGSRRPSTTTGMAMAMTANTRLPLPKPVLWKSVEDILSSSPGHYSKAQVRSGVRARARALSVTGSERERGRRGIDMGRKRAREEEEEEDDVEEEIWSPFLFARKPEERSGKRRRMYVEEEEEEEEGMEVAEEEEIEDEEIEEEDEAILTDTDADGEPEEDREDLHEMVDNHPFFFAEAEGSSPIKLVDEDDEEGDEMEEEEGEQEQREEIILASDSEDSMYDEEGEAEEEKEEDEWNVPYAFINYLKTRGFHEQEPDEDDESDDDEPTLKRLRKKDDEDEDEDDEVIAADPSSTPGLTTCPSSSSSLPPSSPPPIIPVPVLTQNKPKYTTHMANTSSASLPARLPSSSSSTSTSTSFFSIPFSPKSTSSRIVLHHHYPNTKYTFTPAPPRDPLCRLRIGRLEKRLRKMKSESVLTACDEPPEGGEGEDPPAQGAQTAAPVPVGEDVDELAGDEHDREVLVPTGDTEFWDPFGDEVEL